MGPFSLNVKEKVYSKKFGDICNSVYDVSFRQALSKCCSDLKSVIAGTNGPNMPDYLDDLIKEVHRYVVSTQEEALEQFTHEYQL